MRLSKKDVLYDDILDRLIGAKYRFGERILVKELAAETGASRQPIMAALNGLSADGFVRIIPQVGCEVINPTIREIGDFYKMFARLEGLLAELAAERRAPGQLKTLKETNRLIRVDLREHGGEDYRDLNRTFHTTFHRMADSMLLDARQSSIFAMSDFFIMQSIGFTPHMADAADEHEQIIAALERQDSQAARVAAEEHIDEVANAVLAGIEATSA
jgi:DNA-binding GntR family transcriptional regulator